MSEYIYKASWYHSVAYTLYDEVIVN